MSNTPGYTHLAESNCVYHHKHEGLQPFIGLRVSYGLNPYLPHGSNEFCHISELRDNEFYYNFFCLEKVIFFIIPSSEILSLWRKIITE